MAKQPQPRPEDERRVQVTARLRLPVYHALRLASTQREIGNRQPYRQGDIIEAALTEWLRREGHIGKD